MNFPYFDIHGDDKTIMSFFNLLKNFASSDRLAETISADGRFS